MVEVASAHGVYDVNAVAWCSRTNRDGLQDLLATTGDDGVVKVWELVDGSAPNDGDVEMTS